MKRWKKWISLLLAGLLLTGCAPQAEGGSLADRLPQIRETAQVLQPEQTTQPEEPSSEEEPQVPLFSEMEYIRPDMQELQDGLDLVTQLSQGEDVEAVMEAVYAFYDFYDWFYTRYYLADIHYSMDLTDGYWEEEYNFCVESSAAVDAALEELYYILAASPSREALEGEDYFGSGFFDDYEGENNWDEAFTAMLEQEGQLQNRYYTLWADAPEYAYGSDSWFRSYGREMAQVLVDLIKLRREMADYWGYGSYAQFAWDFYYYRDYTPEEMESYLNQLQQTLVPIYRQVADTDAWSEARRFCDEEQTFQFIRTAAQNMGGKVWEAFQTMEAGELYHITYGENKYSTSFEVYLTGYQVPFLFVCPERNTYDKLTFAHEFGHFANDHASEGSSAGIDVLEIFSQAMEYLCLCYGEDTQSLTRMKMADSLSTYVEQSAFTAFELAAYRLPESELTVEGLCDLYEEVALDYGFETVGFDPWEFVTVTHFFTNPLYVPSYVVSNDAAMQMYSMELEEPGRGLKRMTDTLTTSRSYFLSYLEDAGLESPFSQERLDQVAEIFRQSLLG